MLRKILLTSFLLFSVAFGKKSDYITFEWLIDVAKTTAYTDHIPHFRRLFNVMKVRGFIECGCGFSTKYFLDHSDYVTSIEFMNPGTSDMWFKECLEIFNDIDSWRPLLFNADLRNDSFNKADAYQCSQHKNYALIDPKYLFDLDKFFRDEISLLRSRNCEVDVAFVDPGVYLRGDMVNLFLNIGIPVVIAHDTASDVGPTVDEGLYGWFKIKCPPEYEKIHIAFGTGTTFWILKNRPDIIDSMKRYTSRLQEMKEGGSFNYCEFASLLAQIADEV